MFGFRLTAPKLVSGAVKGNCETGVEGEILESYATKKRDKSAALKFLKKALKRHGRAETIVTDALRSFSVAMRALGNLKNNRAENSHLPLRRRERAMLRLSAITG